MPKRFLKHKIFYEPHNGEVGEYIIVGDKKIFKNTKNIKDKKTFNELTGY